jgi:hypothetical protein
VVFAIAAFLSFAPLLVFVVLPPLTKPDAVRFPFLDQYTPANQFTLTAKKRGRAVVLSWPKLPSDGARPFYDVIREPTDGASCELLAHAAANCVYVLGSISVTTRTTFVDHPPRGESVYRIVLKAAPTPAKRFGDYLVISRAASVDVP